MTTYFLNVHDIGGSDVAKIVDDLDTNLETRAITDVYEVELSRLPEKTQQRIQELRLEEHRDIPTVLLWVTP